MPPAGGYMPPYSDPYLDPYAPEPLYSGRQGKDWGYQRYPRRNDFGEEHHYDEHAPHHGYDSWHHDVVIQKPYHDYSHDV